MAAYHVLLAVQFEMSCFYYGVVHQQTMYSTIWHICHLRGFLWLWIICVLRRLAATETLSECSVIWYVLLEVQQVHDGVDGLGESTGR
jgi:hypothetical protein